MISPVIEVGLRAKQPGGGNPRVVGGHTDDDRASGVRSHKDHLVAVADLDEIRDRVLQAVDPALEREVAFCATGSAEVEGHRCAREGAHHAVDQLGKRTLIAQSRPTKPPYPTASKTRSGSFCGVRWVAVYKSLPWVGLNVPRSAS